MALTIKILGESDRQLLARCADGVFDKPIRDDLAREFLSDSRHHLAAAIDEGVIVGMASAVHYVHPDKPPELWINEVGVAQTYRRQGIAKSLLNALLDVGRRHGCVAAWVLTDRSNAAAMSLYASIEGAQTPRDQAMVTIPITQAQAQT